MTTIQKHIAELTAELPSGVQLVAVSKYHPAEAVMEAYEAGQRVFGENHAQEMTAKQAELPKDIQWNFIGHLQSNKVKYIAPYVSLIQSVDSMSLLDEINRQAIRFGRTIPCLLQIHVAKEDTKFGFTFDECRDLLAEGEWRKLAYVRIEGLMCMASNVSNEDQILSEFHRVNDFFAELKRDYFPQSSSFCRRSWGMSHDYRLAIKEGSTMVRVGTKIFGERDYSK